MNIMTYEEALKVLTFVFDYAEIKGPFQSDRNQITNKTSNYWHAMHADGAMRVVFCTQCGPVNTVHFNMYLCRARNCLDIGRGSSNYFVLARQTILAGKSDVLTNSFVLSAD